jgi:antirestriction protein
MSTIANRSIDNFADMLDSRDIIARIEWLEEDRETHADRIAAASGYVEESPEYHALLTTGRADWQATSPDADELAALVALAKECEGVRDWEDGAELIRASYFTEYVQDMLESCGDLPRDLSPCIHIDWEATARDFAYDYMCVEFGDVSYWVRS